MNVAATNPYADIGLALKAPPTQKAELGQAEFLRLMTTQLQNQDPFKPMESGEFLSQIAQFSTVSGIQQLNDAFGGLSSSLTSGQALQAAALVGRSVMVESESGYLPAEGSLRGAAQLPGAGRLLVDVFDGSGARVAIIDAGVREAGLQHFDWNGQTAEGRAAAGRYELRARAVANGTETGVATLAVAEIQSVTLGGDQFALELQGLPPATLADVRQFL